MESVGFWRLERYGTDMVFVFVYCCGYRFIHHIRCHWRIVLWRALWLSRSRLGDRMGQIYHSCDGVCYI